MKNYFKLLAILSCISFLSGFDLIAENEKEEKLLSRQKRKLLFPQFTTLQISMCFISKISSLDSHRVAVNSGFQMNYNLPYQLSNYYSPIFWARSISNTSNLFVNFFERLSQSDDIENDEGSGESSMEISTVTNENSGRSKRMLKANSETTGGQFYSSLREILEFGGYHEDCLLKSVCEHAKHPATFDDNDEDVVNELLQLILTPSIHQSFDPEHENDDRELYEEAEKIGKAGGDCELIYHTCKVSPLYSISNFVESNE